MITTILFFFQAEDGIRDYKVTGVQTCALPISWVEGVQLTERKLRNVLESEGVTPIEAVGQQFDPNLHEAVVHEIGRASCRERVYIEEGRVPVITKIEDVTP